MGIQFSFVKKYDEKIYTYLDIVEKNARIDLDTCANNMRKALESLVENVEKQNNITEDELDNAYRIWMRENNKKALPGNLYSHLKGLSTPEVLKKLKINKPSLIPGSKKKIALQQTNGKNKYWFVLDQLREFGNAGSHAEKEKQKSTTSLTFNNLVICLKEVHKILNDYFEANSSPFDANKMSIMDYDIDEVVLNPPDMERTKCEREFYAHTQKGVYNVMTYAVIRQYRISDIEEKLLSRNIDFRQIASRKTRRNNVEGIIPYIQRVDNGAGEYAIIVNEFEEKPVQLKDAIKSMSKEDRCRLCFDIVACFKGIHTHNPPMYHRLLTYESIFVCNYGTPEKTDWIPYLKFDFGKIITTNVDLTVFDYAKDAVERLNAQRLKKYIDFNAFYREDWEKVDIYGLYVLFGDVMSGEILNAPAEKDDLIDMDYPEELLNIWEDMGTDEYPSAEEIYNELEVIIGEIK